MSKSPLFSKQNKSPYSAAFTAGGILLREFNSVLPLIIMPGNVELLEQEKYQNNYLAINAEASRKRVLQEIIKRVQSAPDDFWSLYQEMPESQKRLMLYYLCLEIYPLVKIFHFEVTIPKWRTYKRSLDLFEYKMKLDEIAAKDTEVDSWSDSTKLKVLTVSIRMLNEAGFTKQNEICKPYIDHFLCTYLIKKNKTWFLEACFLNDTERKSLIEGIL